MYRTIDLKNRRTIKFGAYAAYYRLSARRGVKVYGFGDPEFSSNCGVESKYELTKYQMYSAVETDFKFIQRIKCRIVPKVYEVVSVKVGGLWYAGLVMEHVDGVHLDQFCTGKSTRSYIKREQLMLNICQEFTKLTGYIHQDLHGYNVLFNRKTKKYKVIDLTLEFATPSADYAEVG